MDTPFLNRMAAVAKRGPRFFVPGHKGNPAALPFLPDAPRWDLTEVEGACDLSLPDGPLAESEANMARVYGAGATLYSAFGATACIQAMLALFAGAGAGVVAARGCHVAAVRVMAFLEITPRWVKTEGGRPRPEEVDAALAQGGCGAVYVTSPNYYGHMADIAALAGVCRRHGAALLVDNAHGAHLRFFAPNRHPIALGADACADSAHKTLPCLTPAAMLHLRDGALYPRARQALNLFSSTSPSYLVLESLDYAAGLLLAAPPDFEAAALRLRRAAEAAPALARPCDDPLRLVLQPDAAGMGYQTVRGALAGAGIAAEYEDGRQMVLMASPWNTGEDFAALEKALASLPPGPSDASPHSAGEELPLPRAAMPIRAALFGPKQSLPVAKAAGRVMAGLQVACPPGVPLVLPGEEITSQAARALAAGGILQVDVVK